MKIVITEDPVTVNRSFDLEFASCPKDADVSVAVYDPNAENNDKFFEAIADADIIINCYVNFNKELIDRLNKCKVISFESTGYNEVDLEYAKEKGIAVISILDYCTQETAENAFTLMLCLQRATMKYHELVQKEHIWDASAVTGIRRIEGQTIGIVGLGRIGQSVAKKAHGFDMNVIAYDPFLPPEIAEKLNVKLVDFDYLLAESDVISIHMNLTPENVHMFNKETFKKMKKQPILINEGRGQMICEEDLAWALDNGLVRAAGLDMLESEYPDLSACKLMGRENVILNPHSGFMSDTSNYLVCTLPVQNAVAYVNGEPIPNGAVRNGVTLG